MTIDKLNELKKKLEDLETFKKLNKKLEGTACLERFELVVCDTYGAQFWDPVSMGSSHTNIELPEMPELREHEIKLYEAIKCCVKQRLENLQKEIDEL